MNQVAIIGRLAKDVELRNGVAKMTVAVDRGKDRDGNDRGADFIPVTVFGKQAENCAKYLAKGSQVGIQGRIQTGSYEKEDGTRVYTTEVVADRVEFIGSKAEKKEETPQGFSALNEDIPF